MNIPHIITNKTASQGHADKSVDSLYKEISTPQSTPFIMKKYAGFTLVELIVVITILSILGTIGFIQTNGFASSARDSRRVSDMSNIQKAIDLTIVQQGNAPIPANATSYTGGLVTIKIGTVTPIVIPKLSGDFTDPVTKAPYNYSIFGNGNYYQIGIDFENPLSFYTGIPGIETVYADTAMKHSKLSGNYTFDPSLPSLFVLSGTVNSASWGIFSPDVCFVLENVSTNTFGSTSIDCTAKKSIDLKNLDSSLIGYWDAETCTPNCTTSGSIMKDLSGNGNNGHIYVSGSTVISTGGLIGKSLSFSGENNSKILLLKDTGSMLNSEEMSFSIIFNTPLATKWAAVFWDTTFCSSPNRCSNFNISCTPTDNINYPVPFCWIAGHKNSSASYLKWPNTYDKWVKDVYLHYFFTRKNGIAKFYVNGNKISETNYGSGDFYPNSQPFVIGSASFSPGNISYYWTIDDMKFYNRALSDSEIKQSAKIEGF